MKIAIPFFNKRISPRFDCAQSFLLAVVQNGEVIEHEELPASRWTPLERVEKLSDLAVDTLICGGIDEISARGLIFHRVRVYSLVTGRVEDALNSLLKGELERALWSVQAAVGAEGGGSGETTSKFVATKEDKLGVVVEAATPEVNVDTNRA